MQLGPASSDGRACALETFTLTESGLKFFCMKLKYIPLIRDFESLEYATEFGHFSTSEN